MNYPVLKNLAARLFAVVAIAAAAGPALAADPIFPRGIRVGVTPMDGLEPAATFVGFETANHNVKVLMAELPGAAFGEVESAVKSAAGGAAGIKPEAIDTRAGKGYYTTENGKDGPDNVRRYSMIVAGGQNFSGYVAVQVLEAETKAYSDDAVRRMLATVAVRSEVPVEEQLAMMPFRISELGDFKMVRMLAPGAAIILADGNENTGIEAAPFMVLGLVGAAPENAADRGRFAQQTASVIPGLRDARVTMSEPIRIEGAPGYETRIDATSGKDNTPVTVVQWLRFGGANAALNIIASAPRDQWATAFPRFRTVRDGIKSR